MRCERPICAECMRPAAVGFQCPDDVAAGRASVRAPRSALGVAAGPGRPVVTWTLFALNVVAYLLEGFPIGSADYYNPFVHRFIQDNGAIADQPYRLLTGAFLHDGLWHLGLNMLVLVLVGSPLERLIGPVRFLALYLVSAVGGGVLVYLVGPPLGLGASGAIFGLFAAFYLVARRLRLDANSMLATIGINLVLSVVIPGISLYAHLGGLLTGAVIGLIYTLVPSRTTGQRGLQLAGVGVVAVLLVIATLARTAALT